MHITLEQQAHSLHSRNFTSFIFNLINGALFCVIFSSEFPLIHLLVWYVILMIANTVRYAISAHFNEQDLSEDQFLRSMKYYCFGMSMTITVWSSISLFLFPVNSIPHQLYLCLTLCGVLARATPILSVNKNIYRAFIVVMLSPLLVQIASHIMTEMQLAMLLLLIFFGVTMYKSAMFLATSFQRLHDLSSELKGMVSRDGLTKVANRRAFDERMELEWKTAARHGAPISLIMIDIDAFKPYNDTYGHQAGDNCIRQVAQVLEKSVLRGTDFVARYGGEEFSMILPATDIRGAITVAERVRHHVEILKLPHKKSQVCGYVTVSCGVACCIPDKKDSYKDFIEAADKALYLSKNKGRNCVSVSGEDVKQETVDLGLPEAEVV